MSIRRTREQKLQAQQRREEEKYSWQGESSAPTTPPKQRTLEKISPAANTERSWLGHDFRQTVFALLTVLIGLGVLLWQMWR